MTHVRVILAKMNEIPNEISITLPSGVGWLYKRGLDMFQSEVVFVRGEQYGSDSVCVLYSSMQYVSFVPFCSFVL